MPIIRRTYRCSDCGYEMTRTEYASDEPIPDCPACHIATQKVPGLFSIKTNRSRAVDVAQQIAEEDFGLTNMRDNQRAGDTAVLPPDPIQGAEREQITRELAQMASAMGSDAPPEVASAVNGFWGGQMGSGAGDQSVAKEASKAAEAAGASPVGLLEQARDAGISTNMRYDVISRVGTS